jgi:hypothetical protein
LASHPQLPRLHCLAVPRPSMSSSPLPSHLLHRKLPINNCQAVRHVAEKPIAKPFAIATSPLPSRTLPTMSSSPSLTCPSHIKLPINNCRAVHHNVEKPIAKPSAIVTSPLPSRTSPINVKQPIAKPSVTQKIAHKQLPSLPSGRQETHHQAVRNRHVSIAVNCPSTSSSTSPSHPLHRKLPINNS